MSVFTVGMAETLPERLDGGLEFLLLAVQTCQAFFSFG
jgi:hypothetical protein|tara:strand:+ start:894 stop:1007 length:114 start_codon:yes stop_codon:yes gene_type:complete